jgi:hypothetical protein
MSDLEERLWKWCIAGALIAAAVALWYGPWLNGSSFQWTGPTRPCFDYKPRQATLMSLFLRATDRAAFLW